MYKPEMPRYGKKNENSRLRPEGSRFKAQRVNGAERVASFPPHQLGRLGAL